MHKAAVALTSWTLGREPPEEPFPLSRLCFAVSASRAPLPDAHRVPDASSGALGLEPEPSALRVVIARHAARAPPEAVSSEAQFVYSLAADLFREHGHGWRLAVDTARKCWQHIAVTELPRQMFEPAAIDIVEEAENLVPLVGDDEAPARS